MILNVQLGSLVWEMPKRQPPWEHWFCMKCNCPSEGYLNWQVIMPMESSLKQKWKRLSKQPHVCFINCNCVYVKVMCWLATFAKQEVLGQSDQSLYLLVLMIDCQIAQKCPVLAIVVGLQCWLSRYKIMFMVNRGAVAKVKVVVVARPTTVCTVVGAVLSSDLTLFP